MWTASADESGLTSLMEMSLLRRAGAYCSVNKMNRGVPWNTMGDRSRCRSLRCFVAADGVED